MGFRVWGIGLRVQSMKSHPCNIVGQKEGHLDVTSSFVPQTLNQGGTKILHWAGGALNPKPEFQGPSLLSEIVFLNRGHQLC